MDLSYWHDTWSGFTGLVYRRRCCNADDSRDWVKNMTISAGGGLMLRRLLGKRPPPHAGERK